MAHIDPRDKARFGESSELAVLEAARRRARESGHRLEVGDEALAIGDSVFAWSDGVLETPYGRVEMGEEEWRGLQVLLLSFYATNGRPPGRRELAEMVFAATGTSPPF